ncbi:hypothetical protein EDD11_004255 [Mortierella claussenii]|nr:hypothetical protein EDD11_004255 [Mortierella claussenii]
MTVAEHKPKVLIIGAGMGGLSLAAILERAQIPYEIYEKAGSLKPLGSAICIGPAVMPMFTQLGVAEQIAASSKRNTESFIFNERGERLTHFDYSSGRTEKFGWPTYIISRPKLHNVLLSLVPKHKIHLNNRIVSHTETLSGVTIHTSDGKAYHGDILVGADGAYSRVRELLYDRLAKQDRLPAMDQTPLQFSSVCLVGQTRPLTNEQFEHVEDQTCRMEFIVNESRPLHCLTFTTAEKTVCWMVIQTFDKHFSRGQDDAQTPDWGPEATEAMCEDVADFQLRPSVSAGDLINWSPKEVICKVMLEEKFFQTWSGKRTVLLGDACHKMAPTAGLGAQAAMLDAVILSNHINKLQSNESDEIEEALLAYKNERFAHSKEAFDTSVSMKYLTQRGFWGKLLRTVLMTLPSWILSQLDAKLGAYRPQIAFLPLAKDEGTYRSTVQPSLETSRSMSEHQQMYYSEK